MPLNRDYIGRSYQGTGEFAVGREDIREFAEAIGDPNPLYRDPAAAQAVGHPDVVAPPTFLTVMGFRRAPRLQDDEGLGLDYSKVVHGEQRFVHHRPVHAGDVLTVATRITDMRDAGRNEVMTSQSDVTDAGGALVCTMTSVTVVRGTAAPKES